MQHTGFVVVAYFDKVVVSALAAGVGVLQAEVDEGELYVMTARHLYYPMAVRTSLRTIRITR